MNDSLHPVSVTDLDPQREPRLKDAFRLARTCDYEVGHSLQVTRLALRLFDQLAELHALGNEERFCLAAAGLLHDIGWCEGQKRHHKTALRLAMTSPLLSWDKRQRRIVGCIARYHRNALPNRKHRHFAALDETDRAVVLKLAALLRLADGLDRTHSNVTRDVSATATDDRVIVQVDTIGPADAERAIASRKCDLFEQVYRREVDLRWHAID